MKHIVAFLSIILAVSTISRAQQPGGGNGGPAGTFVVHEWGTFTTLAGSDGVLLPGLYHEEESLPSFVHCFSGFYNPNYSGGKGLHLQCDNATLKMETPVLYFYTPTALSVKVRVDWPGGTISQWYPDRSAGELLPSYSSYSLDFGTQHNGWIEWNANILAKSEFDTIGLSKPYETHTWQAPRATDANVLTDSLGEVEKFLFYRGVGNANFMDGGGDSHYMLKTSFSGDTLVIQNLTHYNILHSVVFERTVDPTTGDSSNHVWWDGPINDGQTVACRAPMPSGGISFEMAITQLRDQLVEKGLYEKEANAMIDTWRQSYFGTPGLRVFWIVPKAATEKSLPLTVTPTPDDIQRILVARSEILTPAFEKKLASDYASGKFYSYYNDRYYLAYSARVQAMAQQASVRSAPATISGISIFPNPAAGTITLSSHESGHADITVVNLLGVEVARLFSGELAAGERSFVWNAGSLAPGQYECVVRMNGRTENVPIVVTK